MKLDNLPRQELLWYQDQDGNKFNQNEWNGLPKDSSKTWYQHCMNTTVEHTIYQGHVRKKWPVRFLKWMIRKMPASWHGHSPLAYTGRTTIGCIYPIVKYLVENKGWHFSEACAVSSQLCEKCLNTCLDECQGTTSNYSSKTYCDYCQYIDPGHLEKYRVWCCYRTLKLGGDVAKAWNEMSVNSSPGYWDTVPGYGEPKKEKKPNVFEKIQSFFGRCVATPPCGP